MNVLKKLNQIESDKPYHGLPKLQLGYHEIFHFRESHGKYGRGVIVELRNEIIFLPQHLAERLDDKDIDELNNFYEAIFLFFGGFNEAKK